MTYKASDMDHITQNDFKERQQQFVEELNTLQERYGVRLAIRAVTENLGEDAVVVKGKLLAVPAPGWKLLEDEGSVQADTGADAPNGS